MAQPLPPKVEGPPPPYEDYGYPNPNQAPGWGQSMPTPPPPPSYGPRTTTVTIQQPGTTYSTTAFAVPASSSVVVVANGCPYCRVGILADSYGCLAIFMAIFFFPIGILCCLAMKEKRCTNCGAQF